MRPWPKDLSFDRDAHALKISFDDGAQFSIPFELLCVESPSAESRGHGAGEGKLVLGKARVSVTDAQPVGRYAVRIVFDDGHDSGLYSWDLLYTMGSEAGERMARYRERVAASETETEA
jgi:DUF971 family protein